MAHLLTEKDHFSVCQYLKSINEQDIRRLGGALGISHSRLIQMKDLPDDMVLSWLNRVDFVEQKPTWPALVNALKEIGQTGIASDIQKSKVENNEADPQSTIQDTAKSISEELTNEDLHHRIKKDLEKIKLTFANLQTRVRQTIEDHNNLAAHIISMDILSAHDEELVGKATSTNEIFGILKNYWSFIDYAILDNLASFVSNDDLNQEMKEYNELLKQFCQSRISDLPPDFLSTSTDTEGVEKVIVTLNMDDSSIQRVKDIKGEIAAVLNKQPSQLILYHIKRGSVIITILIGAAVEHVLKNAVLTEEQVDTLKKKHVVSLTFRNTDLMLRQPVESVKDDETHEVATVTEENQQEDIQYQIQDDQDCNIREELSCVELNPDHWLPVLSKQLGATSKLALKHIGQESLLDLEQFACTSQEKGALRKLLSIENEHSFILQRKNQKEQAKKRQDRACKLLFELKRLQSRRKPYNDEVVIQFENGIREMLQISQTSWNFSQNDKALETLISHFLPFLEHVNKTLACDDLNDSSLLCSASDGLALQGILLSTELNDQLGDRYALLQAPEHVQLQCTFHPPDERSEQFTCENQQNMYRQTIDKLGYSNACTHSAGVLGYSWPGTYCEPPMCPRQSENSYCSTVKYYATPLATYCFSESDLILSSEALDKLKEIDNVITTSNSTQSSNMQLQEFCDQFLKRFGSHATKGPLMFGGMHWCACSCRDFEQCDKDKVFKLQSDTINDCYCVSFDTDTTSPSVSEIPLSVTKTKACGSFEVSSLPEWKICLLTCNNTWSVIDRGTTLVPVWQIIGINYKDKFQNAEKLTELLQESWTQLYAKPRQKDKFHSVKGVLEKVKGWNCACQQEVEDHLMYLLDMKCDLLKHFLDLQAWSTLYLSQPLIQRFLKMVVDKYYDSDTASSHIKMHMKQIVERIDLNIISDFPDKGYISSWLYGTDPNSEDDSVLPITDFDHFTSFIKLLLDSMGAAQVIMKVNDVEALFSTPTHIRIKITTALSREIDSLQCILSKSNQIYEKLFVATLVYPFVHCPKYSTLTLLSHCDVKVLLKLFQEQSKQYYTLKKMRLINVQAYLFKLAVEMYCNKTKLNINVSKDLVDKHLTYIRRTIGDELEPQLATILAKHYVHNNYQLEDLLPDLDCLLETERQHSEKVEKLLTALNIMESYHKKLTVQDALVIREATELKQNSIPLFILKYLMAYDRRCRIALCSSSDDGLSDEDSDSEATSMEDQANKIHPMDALLALLHCADDILRQDLITRLAMCQFAIPFILPDPFKHQLTFPIWAMKSIVKEWRCTIGDNTVEQESPIVNYLTPIISFLRLGKHGKSKSFIMNITIDDRVDHFFHRDCDGGEIKPVIVDGLVELSWYLPTEKEDINAPFSDALAFVNLHGDARHHLKQMKFISQISFMSFVVLTEEDLNQGGIAVLQELSMEPGGVVLLLCDCEVETQTKAILESFKTKAGDKAHTYKLKGRNSPTVKRYVRSRIKKSLCKKWTNVSRDMKKISECTCIAKENGILVDEDEDSLAQGLKLASDIQSKIDTYTKDEVLQLQSDGQWQKWAALDKEEHRQFNRGSLTIERYNSKIEEEKKKVRQRQLTNCVNNLSPVIKTFIKCINSSECEGIARRYFLHCLKLCLNDMSRQKISHLRHNYHEKKRQLSELRDSNASEQRVEECKENIISINKDIMNASFGLEHLLREVGQVYEAIKQSQEDSFPEEFSSLPSAAAELLIDGYPLELMDGDAAHVPITWVTAVLHEVKVKIKDPNVFVLSILGVQSSGKSTLMNTTFGLQFNVSAGRCTRGVFMQLLPIKKELQRKINCEYVLVIDTEGLRAPEMTSRQAHKHDNELATFVIGLANMTMVNLMGEITGDMDDILQTAVHAFLRMKSVKLRPSCQFIHQNVGAVTASTKGEGGRLMFKEKLDKMTLLVANEENCEKYYKYYKCFSDVIHYDDRSDVHYFPNLWNGDPPMAPVNDGYSEKAQKLKLQFVEIMKTSNRSQALSAFTERLKKLWSALLQENFIFSFRNTLEAAAYNSLDVKYGEWAWTLENKMLKWEQSACNKIKNSPSEIELGVLNRNLSQFVNEAIDELEIEMKKFIDLHIDRELIVQWKAETQRRLDTLAKTLKSNVEKNCRHLMTSRQAISEVAQQKNVYRKTIFQNVKALVSSLRPEERLSEEALRKKFNQEWSRWTGTLPSPINFEQETDINQPIQNILLDHFTADKRSIIKKLKDKNLSEWGEPFKLTVKKDTHVDLTDKHWLYGRVKTLAIWTDAHRKHAQLRIDTILREVSEYLQDEKIERYNGFHIYKLLKDIVLEPLESFSKSDENDLDFKLECKIDLSLIVCGYALRWFQNLERAFKKQNDPTEYLECERDNFFSLFKDQYFQTAAEKAAACTFCKLLWQPLMNEVKESLIREVVDDMMGTYMYLHSKPTLKARILIDMGEDVHNNTDNAFDNLFDYLLDAQSSLSRWIEHYTKLHCERQFENDKEPRLVCLAKMHLSHLITLLKIKVHVNTDNMTAREESQDKEMLSINVWVSLLCSDVNLKSILELDSVEEFEHLASVEKVNLENFSEEVQQELDNLHDQLGEVFKSDFSDIRTMDTSIARTSFIKTKASWISKPSKIIYDRLRGCCEQCPFCKEQCDYTDPNHTAKHMVHQHRPQCLGRYRIIATQEIILDLCNYDVGSSNTFRNKLVKCHPYKEYHTIYPRWNIPVDLTSKVSIYWKWFVGHYHTEIAERFRAKTTSIPESWTALKWETVKRELEEMCGLSH